MGIFYLVLYNYRGYCRYYVLLFFLAIVFVVSSIIPCNMTNLAIYTIVPYYVVAIIGSMLVMGLSTCCFRKVKPALVFVGNHTLEILTWHFISFKMVSLLIICIENRPLSHLAYFPVIQRG